MCVCGGGGLGVPLCDVMICVCKREQYAVVCGNGQEKERRWLDVVCCSVCVCVCVCIQCVGMMCGYSGLVIP